MQLRLKSEAIKEAVSQKIACSITHGSQRLYGYVRNKQHVRDKVGTLEDNI